MQILRIDSFLIIFKEINFCKINQSSRNSRNLIPTKIYSLKVFESILCFCKILHCEKYRNFTWFPDVEFLRNGTVPMEHFCVNPLSANRTKWSNTFKQGQLPTNCLSFFEHFVKLALKRLNIDTASAKEKRKL